VAARTQRWDVESDAGVAVLPIRFSVFLDAIDLFDAAAFGVSASEALPMDPQQRLLLESVAAALLLPAPAAAGDGAFGAAGASVVAGGRGLDADCGVFLGITSLEYGQMAQSVQSASRGAFTPYSASGHLTLSVAAGRVSYVFGLKGPSVPGAARCSSLTAPSCCLCLCPRMLGCHRRQVCAPGIP
jgi:acyl transferase domain-containing protein